MSDALKPYIDKAATGAPLSTEDTRAAFDIMMSGDATEGQIGFFLGCMRVRGETVEEITGAAQVMRDKALKVEAPDGAIDTCGTGGDASGTYNISTAAAFVVAAAGVPVAKHGNRALSSKSGSAEVLTALGVNIELEADQVAACIRDAGIGFMMAPRHHGAMKYVGPVRVQLKTRTMFNLLGPLANPSGVKRQLIGVFAREWVEAHANVLKNLGSEKVWVVHGSDGLDELTTTGESYVAELNNGSIRTFTVSPEDVRLAVASEAALKGGDATENAEAMRALLDGASGAYRDIVCLNAGAALVIAEKAADLKDGVTQAQALIDNGSAKAKLEALVAASNG